MIVVHRFTYRRCGIFSSVNHTVVNKSINGQVYCANAACEIGKNFLRCTEFYEFALNFLQMPVEVDLIIASYFLV